MSRPTPVIFSAPLEHPNGHTVVLEITVPWEMCHEHEDDPATDDEDTPPRGVPHVFSTSGYHTDYRVCPGDKP